jgi:O-acetyl-ADP-ribose deacetylase (regulator of RNase III)
MITIKHTDIFSEQVEALVNPVNCVGVMGKGLALQFKQRYRDNYLAYARACGAGEVRPGKLYVYKRSTDQLPYYIINFPTKDHWFTPSKVEYIEQGLQDLVRVLRDYSIESVAIPGLGSGLGGLDWDTVYSCIESILSPLKDVRIIVIPPYNAR